MHVYAVCLFFFFQAEDGIRDYKVTGVQTCALPISFLRQWFSLGEWPSGPAWFLWILLAFDCLAAGFFLMMPKWGDRPSRWYSRLFSSPARFFWTLTAVSGIAYVPMVLAFGPVRWTACGPFMFQTSRLPHYAVWFFAGLFTGAYRSEERR